MRNMSFSMTTQQVRDGSKDITRRDGWRRLPVGALLCAIEKGMGLKRGEQVVRIRVIRVKENRQEPLQALLDDPVYGAEEMRREGFPGMDPAEFVGRFRLRGVMPDKPLSRIVFEYVDEEESA